MPFPTTPCPLAQHAFHPGADVVALVCTARASRPDVLDVVNLMQQMARHAEARLWVQFYATKPRLPLHRVEVPLDALPERMTIEDSCDLGECLPTVLDRCRRLPNGRRADHLVIAYNGDAVFSLPTIDGVPLHCSVLLTHAPMEYWLRRKLHAAISVFGIEPARRSFEQVALRSVMPFGIMELDPARPRRRL